MTDTTQAPVTFGTGGDEPYARALRSDGRLRLTDPDRPDLAITMDVGRWNAAADRVDRSLLDGVDGPVIDIGCGPGRMLVAAGALGLPALGVDVSAEAVAIARRSGGRAVQGSVFEAVPEEGRWDTALVLDGNIGIGGDPAALLARCREIVRDGGRVVVETHDDADADHTYQARVIDTDGHASAEFPWAEVGLHALRRHAARVGLEPRASWTTAGRSFCELVA
ncbi:bifunctional 2-polyprenyl-6-hydroxyphenol methylase/3-demethylubiquinol 3-O-methyltransferase UbiG [Curtobacterium sp. MCBA15_001]|uniref:class I SAM-dependent methyltransferase n=1 Tax=Curtobacterium sp. MCBA15_001 TaxID=1898731 RepID=UPI0008DD19C6|nr:methyltransferase domain-containing protein [Curtobacterium sp. MCBA15_001]OIH97690.1 SAM-dependent methyltransferase [Curtobacterium sp. MCBA15_001]